MKRRHVIAVIVAVVGIGGAVAWSSFRNSAPYAIIKPVRHGRGAPPPEGVLAREFAGAGVQLRAWVLEPAGKPRAVTIALHGISDSKRSQVSKLHFLAHRGVVGIALDLRAHGGSGGEFATYGFHEKADLSRVMDELEKEYPGLPVGLWGTSYGGAVAIQTLAVDHRFDFGIVESTFADMAVVVGQYATRYSFVPAAELASKALARAGEIAEFKPEEVRPEAAIADVTVPILHLHGGRDAHIVIDHARRIAAGVRPGSDYRLVTIEEGEHFRLRAADPELLQTRRSRSSLRGWSGAELLALARSRGALRVRVVSSQA